MVKGLLVNDVITYCLSKFDNRGGIRVGDIVYVYSTFYSKEWKGEVVCFLNNGLITVKWFAGNTFEDRKEVVNQFGLLFTFETDIEVEFIEVELLSKNKKLKW